jgi:hypothetical protein
MNIQGPTHSKLEIRPGTLSILCVASLGGEVVGGGHGAAMIGPAVLPLELIPAILSGVITVWSVTVIISVLALLFAAIARTKGYINSPYIDLFGMICLILCWFVVARHWWLAWSAAEFNGWIIMCVPFFIFTVFKSAQVGASLSGYPWRGNASVCTLPGLFLFLAAIFVLIGTWAYLNPGLEI